MTFFISPAEATSWRMESAQLAADLQAWQPTADVRAVDNPASNQSLEWTLSINGRRVDGALDRTGQAIYVDGAVEDCAAFAVWLRTLVPSQQALVFYDEGYAADVALETDTSVAQLVAPYTS